MRPLSALVLSIGALASAKSVATTEVYYYVGNGQPSHVLNSNAPVSDSYVSPSNEAPSRSAITALADYGTLKATASSTSSGLGWGVAHVSSTSIDEVTFLSGSHAMGELGYATFKLHYDWSLSASGRSASNDAHLVLEGFGGYYTIVRERRQLICDGFGCTTMHDPSTLTIAEPGQAPLVVPETTGTFTFTMPFQFGGTFNLKLALTASAESSLGSSSFTDAGSSAYWGGLVSLTDEAGRAVDDFSMTSASGTDWRASHLPISPAVPEPGTYALMLGGISLLRWRALRKQRPRAL